MNIISRNDSLPDHPTPDLAYPAYRKLTKADGAAGCPATNFTMIFGTTTASMLAAAAAAATAAVSREEMKPS